MRRQGSLKAVGCGASRIYDHKTHASNLSSSCTWWQNACSRMVHGRGKAASSHLTRSYWRRGGGLGGHYKVPVFRSFASIYIVTGSIPLMEDIISSRPPHASLRRHMNNASSVADQRVSSLLGRLRGSPTHITASRPRTGFCMWAAMRTVCTFDPA